MQDVQQIDLDSVGGVNVAAQDSGVLVYLGLDVRAPQIADAIYAIDRFISVKAVISVSTVQDGVSIEDQVDVPVRPCTVEDF